MSRPVNCHHVIYPACGCVNNLTISPPALATHLIVERDRKEKEAKKAEEEAPKKRGRKPTPWAATPRVDPDEEFLGKLPTLVEDPYARADLMKLVDRQLAIASFSEFVRLAWHVVEPTTELEWNWHHELICQIIQGIFEDWEHAIDDNKYRQRVRNCVMNVPPGSLKSRLLAVMFPVWAWIRRPGMRFLCLSVNETAAMRDARDSRTLIQSEWFQNLFQPTWVIKEDQAAIGNYGNSSGGVRLSNTLSSKVIGTRGDCLAGHSLVTTEIGDITIEDLHNMTPGTWPRVWSYNELTQEPELKEIQATRRIDDREVVEVQTNKNSTIVCTPDHKIYSDGEYLPAKELRGRVKTLNGCEVVTQVKRVKARVPVYDIQVEGNHNFFAEGILVHNCLLIDDANDPKEAESKLVRESVNDLYNSNVHNRINHPEKSIRIGIQQRVHAEDWTGYLIKKEGVWSPEDPNPYRWLHVVIPAEFEPTMKCVTPWGEDPRTVKGESLHPVRMSKEFLDKERERFGSNRYAGQMQQRPTLAEGGMVKLKWWRFFHFAGMTPIKPEDRKIGEDKSDEIDKQHPSREVVKIHGFFDRWDFDWTLISVDPAAKRTERGSQHGILVLAGKGPQRFILDDKTMRGDVLDVLTVIERLCAKYDPDRILIEAKAAGPALMTLFEERFQRGKILDSRGKAMPVAVTPIEPQGDKHQRLDSCLPEIEAGLVHLLDGAAWLEPFMGEISGFPLNTYDDRVDALSQCLNHMRSWGNYQLPKW